MSPRKTSQAKPNEEQQNDNRPKNDESTQPTEDEQPTERENMTDSVLRLRREEFERKNPVEAERRRDGERNAQRAEHQTTSSGSQMTEEEFAAKQAAEKEEFMKQVSQPKKTAEDFQAEQDALREEHQARTLGNTPATDTTPPQPAANTSE
jgi:hypothetical protein